MYQCRLGQAKARAVTPMGASLRGLAGEIVKILEISAKAYQAPAAVDMNPDKQTFPEIQTHLT